MDYLEKKNETIDSNGEEKKSYYKMIGKSKITIVEAKSDKESATLEELYKELERINKNLISTAIVIKKENK